MQKTNQLQPNLSIIKKTIPRFFLTLVLCFIGMVVGKLFIPEKIAIFMPFVAILFLIIAIVIRSKDKDKVQVSMTFTYTLAIIMGIGLYPAIQHYVSDIGANLVFLALGITAILFGSFAVYAYYSKEDFSNLGGFLFMSLIAIILLSIAGIWIDATLFHMVLSFAGIMIFSGYVMYDISKLKRADMTEEDIPLAVLNLFLDFINIFMDVLRLVSIFKN